MLKCGDRGSSHPGRSKADFSRSLVWKWAAWRKILKRDVRDFFSRAKENWRELRKIGDASPEPGAGMEGTEVCREICHNLLLGQSLGTSPRVKIIHPFHRLDFLDFADASRGWPAGSPSQSAPWCNAGTDPKSLNQASYSAHDDEVSQTRTRTSFTEGRSG